MTHPPTTYLQITRELLPDTDQLARIYENAASLAVTQVPGRAPDVTLEVGRRLAALGRTASAVEWLSKCQHWKDAVQVLTAAKDFNRARSLAQAKVPSMLEFVGKAEQQFIRFGHDGDSKVGGPGAAAAAASAGKGSAAGADDMGGLDQSMGNEGDEFDGAVALGNWELVRL